MGLGVVKKVGAKEGGQEEGNAEKQTRQCSHAHWVPPTLWLALVPSLQLEGALVLVELEKLFMLPTLAHSGPEWRKLEIITSGCD